MVVVYVCLCLRVCFLCLSCSGCCLSWCCYAVAIEFPSAVVVCAVVAIIAHFSTLLVQLVYSISFSDFASCLSFFVVTHCFLVTPVAAAAFAARTPVTLVLQCLFGMGTLLCVFPPRLFIRAARRHLVASCPFSAVFRALSGTSPTLQLQQWHLADKQ